MPLYEYRCQQCDRHTEKRQKFSDPEITKCPHCGGHLERVISAPNIAFKGGGWYKDLYSSPKPAASGESKGEAKAEGKSEGAAGSDASSKTAGSPGDAAGAATTTAPAQASSAPAPAPASASASSKS